MKESSQTIYPDKVHPETSISRREALALMGGTAIIASLWGCGGGGGGGGVTLGDSSRSAISGNLANLYNQFSTVAQSTSDTWQGTSASMDALRDLPGRATRGPADVRAVIQVLTIGLNANRSAYERLCNLALTLDDLGNAAIAVNSNNPLNASNAVNNEQWLMAMISQNRAAISVTGTLFTMQLIAGLTEASQWVLARTTDIEKLAAYGLFADVFNTWVDALCATANITPNAAWKLDLSANVTAANITSKVTQVNTIFPQLPFSPGYRKPGASLSQLDDASLGAIGIQNFAQSFTGALARITLSSTALTDTFPTTVDLSKAHYDVAIRLASTGLLATITSTAGGVAAAQTAMNTLLNSTDGTTWPGVTGASGNCQVQIVGKTYGFLQALVTAIISTQSALGSLVTGAQALSFLTELETTVEACGSGIQKAIWASVKPDREILRSQQLLNGSVPTTRQVDVVRVTGRLEFDQVGAAGVTCTTTIEASTPDFCPLDPQHPVIRDYRIVVSGLQKLVNCPRTFRNVLICITGLLYDVASHYPDTVAPKFTSGSLTFCQQNYARGLRREPLAAFATIPAITSAQLLCSGVGFIPSRSLTPVNLATIPLMPDLKDITNLVGGVPINVH